MSMTLESLPELVILHIADYLHPNDIARWSATCRRFNQCLPTFLVMRGKNFIIRGKRPWFEFGRLPGIWWPDTPEPYFEGPHLTKAVKKLYISVIWRDQGWGNIKGDIFLTLMRGSESIATKYRPLGWAPHKEETKSGVLTDDPIVTEAREGDYYKFTRNAGGGGGHELHVKNYKVIVQYC